MIGNLFTLLHKNEYNIDISLYLVYLLNLCENIFKYYGLYLSTEIAIGNNHGLLKTLKSLASFSDSLLV